MYLWVARDKASEWRAIQSNIVGGDLPFSVLAEAVCEPLRAGGRTHSNAPDAVVTRLAVRIGELPRTSWVAADLDNLLMDLSAGDVASLVPLLGRFAASGVLVPRPVVRTSTPQPVRAALFDLAGRLGNGLVIRLDGVNRIEQGARQVEAIALESGVGRGAIDLVVDAKDLPQYVSLSALHDAIELIQSCRSWTFLSGTFPASITHLHSRTLLHRLDRTEWEVYRDQMATFTGQRAPSFGDYATQGAIYKPSDPFRPSPSVRYSTETGYLVLRGRRDAPEGHSQYIGHARVLRALPDFGSLIDGPAEDYVRRIATGLHGTGNGTTWRVASLQRHIGLVVAQEAQVRSRVRVRY